MSSTAAPLVDAPPGQSPASASGGGWFRARDYNPMAPGVGTIVAFLLPALALLFLFRALPVAISLFGSFFAQNLRGETAFRGLGNYRDLFADQSFWHAVLNTLKFNLIVNPILVFVAFAFALLTFTPAKGIGFFRSALFLPMTFSTSLAAVLWSLILDPNLGPANPLLAALGIGRQPFFLSESQALPTMMAIVVWKSAGYWMIFLLAGLYRIPGELYEAAQIDGANWWQRMRYITLPQMRRPLAFVLVASTAVNFLFFAPVYIITKGGPNGSTDMLMFRTYESAFVFINWGRALALSTVLLLIIGAIATLQLRFLREKEGEGQ